jgi:hypothetical protein
MVGADKYTQRLSKWRETTAGARERAGFMEAPQTGPAKRASKPMTEPTATPTVMPFSFAPVNTDRMTNIKRPLSRTSNAKD